MFMSLLDNKLQYSSYIATEMQINFLLRSNITVISCDAIFLFKLFNIEIIPSLSTGGPYPQQRWSKEA